MNWATLYKTCAPVAKSVVIYVAAWLPGVTQELMATWLVFLRRKIKPPKTKHKQQIQTKQEQEHENDNETLIKYFFTAVNTP